MAAETPAGKLLVVILDKGDASVEQRVLDSHSVPGGVRVEPLDCRSQADAMSHPLVPVADVVMVWHTILIDEPMIARMSRARCLVRVGVGHDNCNLRACAAAGLPVCNIPNYGTEEVADHALGLILALYRRITFSHDAAARGVVAHGSDGVAALAAGTRRVRGTTLGLLGCGRIGTATALRAKAFGFNILFYDPKVPAGTDKALGITRVHSMEALAAASDVLSIHCDLNASSKHLVNKGVLSCMKRGSFVVNTARGGIIVEQDLRQLLDSGHIAAAAIDVHEVEPYYAVQPTTTSTDGSAAAPAPPQPQPQPLAGAPNCICTPHCAFFSEESFVEMRSLAADSAAQALMGVPLVNCVNARHFAPPADAAADADADAAAATAAVTPATAAAAAAAKQPRVPVARFDD